MSLISSTTISRLHIYMHLHIFIYRYIVIQQGFTHAYHLVKNESWFCYVINKYIHTIHMISLMLLKVYLLIIFVFDHWDFTDKFAFCDLNMLLYSQACKSHQYTGYIKCFHRIIRASVSQNLKAMTDNLNLNCKSWRTFLTPCLIYRKNCNRLHYIMFRTEHVYLSKNTCYINIQVAINLNAAGTCFSNRGCTKMSVPNPSMRKIKVNLQGHYFLLSAQKCTSIYQFSFSLIRDWIRKQNNTLYIYQTEIWIKRCNASYCFQYQINYMQSHRLQTGNT